MILFICFERKGECPFHNEDLVFNEFKGKYNAMSFKLRCIGMRF